MVRKRRDPIEEGEPQTMLASLRSNAGKTQDESAVILDGFQDNDNGDSDGGNGKEEEKVAENEDIGEDIRKCTSLAVEIEQSPFSTSSTTFKDAMTCLTLLETFVNLHDPERRFVKSFRDLDDFLETVRINDLFKAIIKIA